MSKSNCIVIQKTDSNLLSKCIKFGGNYQPQLGGMELSSHGIKLYNFYTETQDIDGDQIIRLAELQFELWDTLHNKMGITQENIKNIINVALEIPTSEASMDILCTKINIYLQILNSDKVSLNESLLSQHEHFQSTLDHVQITVHPQLLFHSDPYVLSKVIESGPTPTYGISALSHHALNLYNFYNNTASVDAADIIELLSLQYELWTIINKTDGLEPNYREYLYGIVFMVPTTVVDIFNITTQIKRVTVSLQTYCQDLSPTDADVANRKVIDEVKLLQHETRIFLKDSLSCRTELPLVIRSYGHYLCKYEAFNLPVNNLVFLDCLKAYKKLINCIFIDYSIPPNPNSIEVPMNTETNTLLNTVDLVLALQEKVKVYCLTYQINLPEDISTHGLSLAETPVTADIDQVNKLFEELKQFTIMLQTNYTSICPFDTFGWVMSKTNNGADKLLGRSESKDSDTLPPNPDDVNELVRTTVIQKTELSELLKQYFDLPQDIIRYGNILHSYIPANYEQAKDLNVRLTDLLSEVKEIIKHLPVRPNEEIAVPQPSFSIYPIKLPDHLMAALEEFLMQPSSHSVVTTRYTPIDNTGIKPELDQLVIDCMQLACQLDHYMSKYHANFSDSLKSSFLSLMDSHRIASKSPTVPDMQGILNNLINFKEYLTRVYPTLIFESFDTIDVSEMRHETAQLTYICHSVVDQLSKYINNYYQQLPQDLIDNFNINLMGNFRAILKDGPSLEKLRDIHDSLIQYRTKLETLFPTFILDRIKEDMNLDERKARKLDCESQLHHLEYTVTKCYKLHTEIRDLLINNQIPLLIKPYVQKLWDFTELYLNQIDMNYIDQYNAAYIDELHSRLDKVLSVIYSPAVLNAPNVCVPDLLCLHTVDSYMIVAMNDCKKIWLNVDVAKEKELTWKDGIDVNKFAAGPRVSDLERVKSMLGLANEWLHSTDNIDFSKYAENLCELVIGKSTITRELAVYLLELQIDLARLLSKPGIQAIDMQQYIVMCTTLPNADGLKHNIVELCKKVSAIKLDVTINNYGSIERSLFLN